MAKHSLSVDITKQMKTAIKQFGTYSFLDKGPSEVMDLRDLSKKFNSLPQNEKVQVSKDLKKSSKENSILLELILSDKSLMKIFKDHKQIFEFRN